MKSELCKIIGENTQKLRRKIPIHKRVFQMKSISASPIIGILSMEKGIQRFSP